MNSLELGKKVIKEKIPLIPKNPGVYKMISSTGEILYIGKAKNIPNRLKSYVTESNLPIRTERMLSLTHNLETTTTSNESEALLLEANLIKKHKEDFDIKYKEWIITYSDESFEKLANSLENLIETNKETYDINQAKYLYRRAMELELDFFNAYSDF